MSFERDRSARTDEGQASESGGTPGKRPRTAGLPVQRKAGSTPAAAPAAAPGTAGPAEDPFAVHLLGARGVEGSPAPLPFLDRIQASFGPEHDVARIGAHVGGAAADAAQGLGATAYATGDQVAFATTPDLHTAAHEAAHVVQQARGVNLYGGVGEAGDAYERQADAVADRVVAGQSAADLLAGGPTGGGRGLQRKEAGTTTGVPTTQTQDQAVGQVGDSLQSAIKTPYPEHRNYPEPPTKASEIESRLRGYGVKQGPTAEEKAWLYDAATVMGLFYLVEEFKQAEAKGAPLDPRRANVVSFALSQIGLVEAHTAVPDPADPSKKVRLGFEHLRQYYQDTGRTIDEGVLRDPRIKVGPLGGNKIGSWCQIFSEWAVTKGGGTFHVAVGGKNQVKVPRPGDVAYMHKSQHMAVVVSVEGDQVTTVDGNMPDLSSFILCTRPLSDWNQGFHDSFPGT